MRLSGDQVWTWVTYGGLFYGQLGGAQIIGQMGGGADPDGHYGSCNQSDPFTDTAVSGRFVLFDAQAGHGIDHQHVITGFQFLPSGNAAAALVKNVTSPYGDPNLDPSIGDQLLVNYPVTQGDRITFTNLDYFPHTVTACQDPCHAWHPTPSGAFDGDLHLAGDQYTIDTNGLKPGTYHYFCEIHHYMRGEFTVLPKSGTIASPAH